MAPAARTATDNLGSLRVLQKCRFAIVGHDKGFAHVRGEETEEYVLRLDPDPVPPATAGTTPPDRA